MALLRTDIVGICKKCGDPLTESAHGTGFWDFRVERDPHECFTEDDALAEIERQQRESGIDADEVG